MTGNPTAFDASIPAAYDRYLGPALFVPYAEDKVRRVAALQYRDVLELACGTGILTRLLCAALRPGTRFVATDLSPDMLDFARRKDGMRAVSDWRQADMCALPFDGGGFDVVVCQFGFMFPPDKARAFAEARRALRPGGTLLFNVWDALDANPFGRVADEVIARFFPSDPPLFYQIPFGLYDTARLTDLVRAAGFTDVLVDAVLREAVSPSARDFALGLVTGNPVLTAIRERGTVPVDQVVDAVERAVRDAFGDRPARSPMRAYVVTAR
jgi:SAM-dependent methyltransferase